MPTTTEQDGQMRVIDFIKELKFSKTVFYNELKKKGIKPPGKYLSPLDQNYYRFILGFPPKYPELPNSRTPELPNSRTPELPKKNQKPRFLIV